MGLKFCPGPELATATVCPTRPKTNLSPSPGRDGFYAFSKSPVNTRVHRAMLNDVAGRVRSEVVAVFPIGSRPDGTGAKAAAAIRADVFQNVFHA